MNIPDNYDQWLAHEARQDQWLSERYVCEYCGQPIQEDFYYEINGDFVCEKCLDKHFRKDVLE